MGYYMRVLLEDWEERPLSELLAHSRAYGHELRTDAPQDDADWRDAELYGPEAVVPIEVDVNVGDDMVREELDELREELEDCDADTKAVAKVHAHLDRTRAIVAVRPLASEGERGLKSAWAVLDYYAQRDGVLFHADAEGFYDGPDLIVATG
ncbi:MAG TPA: hypothetical protein VFX80_10695 [Solirubrobacteraceae bacterium]|nr:hypothetical protein [Solirubrobacteraceae bacterium]